MQTHQLNSLQQQTAAGTENQAAQQWVLELQVLNGERVDTFLLEIDSEEHHCEADENDSEATTRRWTLMIRFNLACLVPMYVQLVLVNESVSATIWAEQQKTLKAVNHEVDSLRHSLSEIGVTVTQIDCQIGSPPNRRTRMEQQLIDTHS